MEPIDETLTADAAALAATDAPSDVQSTLGSDAGLSVTEEAAARYELRREFGRGGQAVVFLAFDTHIGREVAFKQQLDREADARRFLQEGRITGTLEHPGIVPVYEIGRRPDGTCYYTQKLVRGKTLRQALADCTGLGQRMRLLPQFLGVCQAVAYAHSRGVIHRDLKPENVMIGEYGEAIVLDWGLAKRLGDAELPGSGTSGPQSEKLTRDGALLGTPLYMSPEQADGRTAQLDRRSDVFSLGAMLYELLVGRTPFAGATVAEVIERVSSVAMAPIAASELRLAPELVAVATRALAKDPDARFTNAEELATELASFLAGRRIASYEYSSLELLRRFVKKNRALVALGAGLFATVVLAAILLARSEARSRANLIAAQRNLADALLERATAAEKKGRLDLAAGYYAMAGTQVDEPRARWGAALAVARAPEAAVIGSPLSEDLKTSAIVSTDGRWMGIKTRHKFHIRDLDSSQWVYSEPDATGGVFAASNDGRVAQAGGRVVVIRRWSQPAATTTKKSDGFVGAIVFLPDGRLVLGRMDGKLEICDAALACQTHITNLGKISALAASTDGRFLIVGAEGTLARFDVATATLTWKQAFAREMIRALAITRDGKQVAVGTLVGDLGIVVADSGSTVARLVSLDRAIGNLAFSPDGELLHAGTFEGDAYLFQPPMRAPFAVVDKVGAAAWFSAARQLTLIGFAGSWQRIDLEAFRQRWNQRSAHHMAIWSLAPCGGAWLTGGQDGRARLWSSASRPEIATFGTAGDPLSSVACVDEGASLVTSSYRGGVKWWTRDGKLARETSLNGHARSLLALRNGDLIIGDDLGKLFRIGHGSGQPALVGAHEKEITDLARVDEQHFVSASLDGTARIWNLARGSEVRRIPAGVGLHAVTASPDGTLLVTAGRDPWIRIWDARSGQLRRSLPNAAEFVDDLSISPDGKVLASASSDRTVLLWSLESGERLATIGAGMQELTALGWSTDGTELAFGDFTGSLARLRFDPKHVAMSPAAMLEEIKRRFHLVQEGVELHTSLGAPTKPD